MKTILMILFLLVSGAVHAGDEWMGQDKVKHAGVSAVMGAVAGAATGSRAQAFGACLAVGAAKEVWDAYHPGHTPSFRDLAADAAGCAVGVEMGLMVMPSRRGLSVVYVTGW